MVPMPLQARARGALTAATVPRALWRAGKNTTLQEACNGRSRREKKLVNEAK